MDKFECLAVMEQTLQKTSWLAKQLVPGMLAVLDIWQFGCNSFGFYSLVVPVGGGIVIGIVTAIRSRYRQQETQREVIADLRRSLGAQ